MNIAKPGAGGGTGQTLVNEFTRRAHATSGPATQYRKKPDLRPRTVAGAKVVVTDATPIQAQSNTLAKPGIPINSGGMLHMTLCHPEITAPSLVPDVFIEAVRINGLPTLMTDNYFHTRFHRHRQVVFTSTSARIGRGFNKRLGGWYSYRGSKTALDIRLKTPSIEWHAALPRAVEVAVHPGTPDTCFSKTFRCNVPNEKLFSPQLTARYLTDSAIAPKTTDMVSFPDYRGNNIP